MKTTSSTTTSTLDGAPAQCFRVAGLRIRPPSAANGDHRNERSLEASSRAMVMSRPYEFALPSVKLGNSRDLQVGGPCF